MKKIAIILLILGSISTVSAAFGQGRPSSSGDVNGLHTIKGKLKVNQPGYGFKNFATGTGTDSTTGVDTGLLKTVIAGASSSDKLAKTDSLGQTTQRFKAFATGTASTFDFGGTASTTDLRIYGTTNILRLYGAGNNLMFSPADAANNSQPGNGLGSISFMGKRNGSATTMASINAFKMGDSTNRNGYVQYTLGSNTSNALAGTWSFPNGFAPNSIRVGTTYYNSPDSVRVAVLQVAGCCGAGASNLPNFIIDKYSGQTAANMRIRIAGKSVFSIDADGNLDTVKAAKFFDNNYNRVASIESNGDIHARSLYSTSFQTITTSTTINTASSGQLLVNTSAGTPTITFNLGAADTGKIFFIYKTSEDSNDYILTTASGLIDGETLLRVPDDCNVTFDGTNYHVHYSASPNVDAHQAIVLSAFNGAKADMKRIRVSTTAGSTTITAASGTFSVLDTGKVICIKKGRNNAAYTDLPQTLTTKISGYVSSSQVTIATAADNTNTNDSAYFGTNNYDDIQNAINFCNTNKIGKLLIDGAGTYLVCPKLSTIAPTQSVKGFNVNAPIQIAGTGVNAIKFSVEDDNNTNKANNYNWRGFYVNTCGDFLLRDLKMIAPDRFRTELAPDNSYGVLYNSSLVNCNGSFTMDNVHIIGDDSSFHYRTRGIQWVKGISLSQETDLIGGKFFVNLNNSSISANVQNIEVFADTTGKYFECNNVKLYNSGTPLLATAFGNHGIISAGDNTLQVTGIPGFSFYDYPTGATITMYVGTDTFSQAITSIIDATTADMAANATVNLNNATIVPLALSGHSVYHSPNVSFRHDRLKIYDAGRWDYHVYSGGGVAGDPLYTELERCGNYTTANKLVATPSNGWLIHQGGTLRMNNCDSFYLNTGVQPINVVAKNTLFTREAIFQGRSDLYNCQGEGLYGYAVGDTVKAYNCTFSTASGHSGLGSWLKVYNSQIANTNSAGNTLVYGNINNAGKTIYSTGTNSTVGTATLSGGTVTVSTTAVGANSIIFVTGQGCTNCGTYHISAKTAGTSFTITSSNASDASTVAWWIIN